MSRNSGHIHFTWIAVGALPILYIGVIQGCAAGSSTPAPVPPAARVPTSTSAPHLYQNEVVELSEQEASELYLLQEMDVSEMEEQPRSTPQEIEEPTGALALRSISAPVETKRQRRRTLVPMSGKVRLLSREPRELLVGKHCAYSENDRAAACRLEPKNLGPDFDGNAQIILSRAGRISKIRAQSFDGKYCFNLLGKALKREPRPGIHKPPKRMIPFRSALFLEVKTRVRLATGKKTFYRIERLFLFGAPGPETREFVPSTGAGCGYETWYTRQ